MDSGRDATGIDMKTGIATLKRILEGVDLPLLPLAGFRLFTRKDVASMKIPERR